MCDSVVQSCTQTACDLTPSRRFQCDAYLSNHQTNELEEVKMIRIDTAEWVGVIEFTFASFPSEERVVWIEHLSGQNAEPFSGQPSSVDSFFPLELNDDTTFEIIASPSEPQLVKRIDEEMIPPNHQSYLGMYSFLPDVQFVKEVSTERHTNTQVHTLTRAPEYEGHICT